MTDIKPLAKLLTSEPREAVQKVNAHLLSNTKNLEKLTTDSKNIGDTLTATLDNIETALEILS